MRKLLWLFIRIVCTAGFLSACTEPHVACHYVVAHHESVYVDPYGNTATDTYTDSTLICTR